MNVLIFLTIFLIILNLSFAEIEDDNEMKLKQDIDETILENSNDNNEEVEEEILALPLPDKDTSINEEEKIYSFKLGETLKLDNLGPMIVNSDGIIYVFIIILYFDF